MSKTLIFVGTAAAMAFFAASLATAANLTEENVKRVKNGMTTATVESILGPPDEVGGRRWVYNGKCPGTIYPRRELCVYFEDNAAAKKVVAGFRLMGVGDPQLKYGLGSWYYGHRPEWLIYAYPEVNYNEFLEMLRDATTLYDIPRIRMSMRDMFLLGVLSDAEYQELLDAAEVAAKATAPSRSEVLIEYSKSEDPYWRLEAATADDAPPETLTALSNDEDTYVRKAVAKNANTPAEVLAALSKESKDEYWDVRCAVAENGNTPAEVLAALSNDKYADVRRAVAENTNTPAEVLAALSKDEYAYVRKEVAKNANTPPEILKALCKDRREETFVREAAAYNLKTRAEVTDE